MEGSGEFPASVINYSTLYQKALQRISTYQNHNEITGAPLSPTALAFNGFVFSGQENIIQCEECGRVNDIFGIGQEPSDKSYHHPGCSFVQSIGIAAVPSVDLETSSQSLQNTVMKNQPLERKHSAQKQPEVLKCTQHQNTANDRGSKFWTCRLCGIQMLTQNYTEDCPHFDNNGGENDTHPVMETFQNGGVSSTRLPTLDSLEEGAQQATNVPDERNPQVLSNLGIIPVKETSQLSYPRYSTQQDRLATFHCWPICTVHRPDEFAALGFFYLGYSDAVRCFHCGLILHSWMPGHDINEQHIRYKPECPFVQNFISVRSVVGNARPTLNSQYHTIEGRERSFRGINSLSHLNLPALGFFYKGYGDSVQCFSCCLSLRNLQSCDINAVHKAKSPSCAYLRTIREEENRMMYRNITLRHIDEI